MLHEPASSSGPDPAAAYKARLGILMFVIYCVVYAGFVLLNVFSEGKAMAIEVFMGLNLAVIYGFALIILALVMAVIYNWFCTRQEALLADEPKVEGGE